MALCRRKRIVTPDKILTNKESGDEFSVVNSDDEGGNNRQKQGYVFVYDSHLVKMSPLFTLFCLNDDTLLTSYL
ncbi:hypothetical protein TNIN_422341 [Trichonephila inaurata madagascariensis]|uniref:Uncharacterized protein n=1 Tax=Trichonephila inaurata madagascariensis TaxID=2747483 RepID=A0A8X6IPJ2_9ARAC|nr:hypothetical protein TNIN_163191 [Trichonephila inaurata madagascariensis]GFY52196.1 hypothetical protein TNIN_422341 [Trichonephila inaurata madagascariensis]